MQQDDVKTVLVAFGATLLFACGGTSGNGLFGNDADASAQDSGVTPPPPPSNKDGGGVPPQDATLPPVDSGPLPPQDAGPGDAAKPDADPGIRCFGEPSKYCSLTSTCCVTGAETAGICGNAKACTNAGGVAFPCADQRNCSGGTPGDVCCAAFDATAGKITGVQCQATCATDGTEHQLCDPATKPDECAALGLTCKKPTVPGYAYCQ